MSPLNFVCICFSPCHDWRGFFLCGSFINNCCGRKKETNVSYSSVPLFLQVVDYTIYFIYLKNINCVCLFLYNLSNIYFQFTEETTKMKVMSDAQVAYILLMKGLPLPVKRGMAVQSTTPATSSSRPRRLHIPP